MTDDQMQAKLEKVKKLLKLADRAKNTSEAEASLAAAKVQEFLQELGMTMAELQASGGTSDDGGRTKKEVDGFRINHPWQIKLMMAIAETNFCICRVNVTEGEYNGRQVKSKRFQLVGRKVNVEATKMVYEYLFETMRRLALEQGYVTKDLADGRKDNESHLRRKIWNEGCTDRLASRLKERYEQALRESAARAKSPTGNTKNALVLSDVYGSEADLNNDYINGFPPGTTATKRREIAERNARIEARMKELMAQGIERIEAYYLANGYGPEEAKAGAVAYHQMMNRRSSRRNWTRWNKQQERRDSEAYRAGSRTGEKIGLDPQAGHSDNQGG